MNKDNAMNTATILKLKHYLENDMPLTEYQKQCIIYAVNKVNDVRQTPYYEVVYHDEYDRTEHRIMEPTSVTFIDDGHVRIRKDHFELDFNRMLP